MPKVKSIAVFFVMITGMTIVALNSSIMNRIESRIATHLQPEQAAPQRIDRKSHSLEKSDSPSRPKKTTKKDDIFKELYPEDDSQNSDSNQGTRLQKVMKTLKGIKAKSEQRNEMLEQLRKGEIH